MIPVLLALALGGTPTGPASCATECRAVRDPELRARACGACPLGDGRAAWVVELARSGERAAPELDRAMALEDWQVQSAVLSARAGLRKSSRAAELARYVVADPTRGSALAIHVAGARGQSAAQLDADLSVAGADGRKARALLKEHAAEARAALEVDIYETDPATQRDALRHLSAYLSRSPAAVVLEAMKTRPDVADAAAARALSTLCLEDGEAVGRAVSREASPAHQAEVNRLLAVYSTQLDAARPRLGRLEPLERAAAVNEVGALAPLSAPELETAMRDPDGRVRRSALRWLARGEGVSISALAASRVRAADVTGAASWLRALRESGDTECGATARALSQDPKLAPAIRGQALPALTSCDGVKALPQVKAALADPTPEIRAGGVAALEFLPRVAEAQQAAMAALSDPAPAVVAAAARVVAQPGQPRALPALEGLLAHPAVEVRVAAVEALERLGRPEGTVAMGRRLKPEPDVGVRRAIVRALRELGGGPALSALADAANQDPDPGIRAAAQDAMTPH